VHETGAFDSDAVLPDSLNLNVQPAEDVYWRSASEDWENATVYVVSALCGGCPGHETVVFTDPFHVDPRKLFGLPPLEPLLLLLPPHANARTNGIAASLPFICSPNRRASEDSARVVTFLALLQLDEVFFSTTTFSQSLPLA